MEVVLGASLEAVAGTPRGARDAGAGGLPVGQPLLQVLLPGRVRPGGHDGDHHTDQRGSIAII